MGQFNATSIYMITGQLSGNSSVLIGGKNRNLSPGQGGNVSPKAHAFLTWNASVPISLNVVGWYESIPVFSGSMHVSYFLPNGKYSLENSSDNDYWIQVSKNKVI